MGVEIHSTALVDPQAKFGVNVKIGPYCLVGPFVELGDGCVLHSHVVMGSHITAGPNNLFFHFSTIGVPPQDRLYKGEPTTVEIGEGNTFREYVNIHRGTLKEEGVTRIGSHNFLMTYVHVGHDAVLSNHCVVANSVNFAGHVRVQERVIVGGGCNVAPYITLGRGCYIAGATPIHKDIPPFCSAYGHLIRLRGLNIIGMKRQGIPKPVIIEVMDFYRDMEASPLGPRAFVEDETKIGPYKNNSIVQELSRFIKETKVGLPPFTSV